MGNNIFDYNKVKYKNTIYTIYKNSNEITVQQLTVTGIEILKPGKYSILADEFSYLLYREDKELFFRYNDAKAYICNELLPSLNNKKAKFIDKIYDSSNDVKDL